MYATTQWELFAEIRQDALAFLSTHMLVPDTLYISGDGWVEAVYTYPTKDNTILNAWDNLESTQTIEIRKPLLEVGDSTGITTLRVHFNLYSEVKQSMWQRIKKLVS